MELRNINTFLHVAELHSFSHAAKELGYSQSAVSTQIAQLESELAVPLFDRVGKTVRLTGAGEIFLDYARILLTTTQQARSALQAAPLARGVLRVAMADSLCSAFLPGLVQRFQALCPQVELVLRTTTSGEMVSLLNTNQIDLGYTLDHPLAHPSLVIALDEPEPIRFVAPAGHPLAQRETVALEELTGQTFLLTERGMSYRDALEQALAARHLSLRPSVELGSAALLCQLVERGLGLSFLPEYLLKACLDPRQAVVLEVPDCRIEMRRQLFYHKDKWLTAQMQQFIALARDAGPDSPDPLPVG